jgi:replicative DNA helicase
MMARDNFDMPAAMWSKDAEMSLLGAFMLDAPDMEECLAICPDEAFVVVAHGQIMAAFRELSAMGSAVDVVTVKNLLITKGQLGDIGGLDYLMQLAEYVPTQLNAVAYAEIVRQKYDLREMDKKLQLAARAIRAGNLLEGVIHSESVTDDIYSKANILSIESVMADVKRGLRPGVPHYLPIINEYFDQVGFGPGLLHAICMESGKGKSTSLCQQVVHNMGMGIATGVVSLEMSAADLLIKVVRQMTGFRSEDEAARHSQEAHSEYQLEFAKVRHWLDSGELAILDEADSGGATWPLIRGWMDNQIKSNVQCFIIDYVQNIKPLKGQKDDFNFHNSLSSDLRVYAKSRDVSLIGLFQVEFRQGEMHFRGGSQYFRDASTHITKILSKPDETGYQNEYLAVTKNRYGRLGKRQVFYNPRFDRLSEWEGGR